MQDLIIEETKYTPKIEMLFEKRYISFKGKSYPENTFDFYMPVVSWLKNYFQKQKDKTIVDFEISYFNSSSSKLFFDLFDIFEEFSALNCEIVINWYYDSENESALEAGEDFKDDFDTLNINLKEL